MFGGTSEASVGVADADGEAPHDPKSRRRWYLIAGSTVSIVGFSACLTTLNSGMRDVLKTSGGFCASGGAYQIAHQCSSGDARQVFIGIVGMLVAGGFFAGLTAFADGPVITPSGLMWAALFGSLGWEFISPPKGAPNNLVVGVVFLLMAAAGLWPAITSGLEWIKRGGAPEPDDLSLAFDGKPLVRAALTAQPAGAATATSTAATGNQPVIPSRLVIPPKDIV